MARVSSSSQIAKIVTHHEQPARAAELLAKFGVAAVGWNVVGNLRGKSREEIKKILRAKWKNSEGEAAKAASQLLIFRDRLRKGTMIFAYQRNNKVALVGVVDGTYKFNDRNEIGDPKGKIRYPNQIKVKWWEQPRNFDRELLPGEISRWVARIGTIDVRAYGKVSKLKGQLERMPSGDISQKAMEIADEKEIKDYMERHLKEVERGLSLVQREYYTSQGPMDFLAEDASGHSVVIEVKLRADDSTSTQTRRYMRAFLKDKGLKSGNIRGIIVGQEVTNRCREDVMELRRVGFDIVIYKCRKRFGFERTS